MGARSWPVVAEAVVAGAASWSISSPPSTVRGTMNRYAAMAMTHWSRWAPTRVAAIPPAEREEFFTGLGIEVAEQITRTEEALLAAADLSGLGYLQTTGRLRAIRRQAEDLVLAEMVWIDPEPGTDPSEEIFLDPPAGDPLAAWADPDGMPLDKTHPLWAMQADEQISPEEFARHLRAWLAGLPHEP